MIKLIVVTTILSLSHISYGELNKGKIDMKAVTKAHANIDKQKLTGHSESDGWSKDQVKQAKREQQYKAAISANPENKKNYAYLAGLYLANNKTSKALKVYQKAIIHDPENPKLFAAISIAYLHKARYGMAKAMADEALRLNPKMKGVEKINEYVDAKQKAIKAASQVPAGGTLPSMKTSAPHGATLPASLVEKPSDLIRLLKKP